ncbi:SAM-dependent methyltransferase [Streptomyces sp. A7024]|uniref:SAM-dependent methyltransferase n=1 Tax=Streptomyces coryli TaxID=1128680 RepID=A0A6G4TS29_9ACTN|nr:SAM-dependent methyltransferase [Streptomyces coryli]NGN62819.1 SAM-dependent methyltransferase [Streptomyces coryli]
MPDGDRMPSPEEPQYIRDLRTDRPHPARVYDYLLGGKNNYAADRAAAEAGKRANPNSLIPPRENRAFLRRAVHYLAAQEGIDQFLDVGTGLPTSPNVHEVAQAANPAARVVYVDNDPIVLTHARALLVGTPEGRTKYIEADLRDPEAILNAPELQATLDLTRPVGLLLIAIMHFVPDEAGPLDIAERLLSALPSGSFLALSHLTGDFDPKAWEGVAAIYRKSGVIMQVRTKPEVERFFDGLELVDPGVQSLPRWRPEAPAVGTAGAVTDAEVSVYGGVGRKR